MCFVLTVEIETRTSSSLKPNIIRSVERVAIAYGKSIRCL